MSKLFVPMFGNDECAFFLFAKTPAGCKERHRGAENQQNNAFNCAIGIGQFADTALGNYYGCGGLKKIRAVSDHATYRSDNDSKNDGDGS